MAVYLVGMVANLMVISSKPAGAIETLNSESNGHKAKAHLSKHKHKHHTTKHHKTGKKLLSIKVDKTVEFPDRVSTS